MSMLGRRRAGVQTQSDPASGGGESPYPNPEELEESEPGEFTGEFFKGAHFYSLNVPDVAPAGGKATITGEVHFDNPGVIASKASIQVRVEASGMEPIIERVDALSHCQSRNFSVDVPMPNSVGSTVVVDVKGQRIGTGPLYPVTGEEAGPFRIEAIDPQKAQVNNAISYLPSAAVGGGAGYLAARATGREENTALFTTAGVGAGVLTGIAGDPSGDLGLNLNLGNLVPSFGGSATTIAVAGLGLAGAAWFLNSSGASEVLQPVGDAAGRAVDAGTSAVDRARR